MVKRIAFIEPRVKHGVFLIQKNRVWRHGFSLGRSVEADAAASHPPSFGGLSPPRTTPCPQTHRVCGRALRVRASSIL